MDFNAGIIGDGADAVADQGFERVQQLVGILRGIGTRLFTDQPRRTVFLSELHPEFKAAAFEGDQPKNQAQIAQTVGVEIICLVCRAEELIRRGNGIGQSVLDVMQLAVVVEGEPLLRLGDDFVRQPCRIGTPNQFDGLVAVKNGV